MARHTVIFVLYAHQNKAFLQNKQNKNFYSYKKSKCSFLNYTKDTFLWNIIETKRRKENLIQMQINFSRKYYYW